MKGRYYRHVMRLITAGVMALSVLSPVEVAVAASMDRGDVIQETLPGADEELSAEGRGVGEAVPEGAALSGMNFSGTGAEGAVQNGPPQNGELLEGVPQEETSQGGISQDGINQNENPQEGIPQGEVIQGEVLQNGLPQEGMPQNENPQEGIPQDGTLQEGAAANGEQPGAALAALAPEERSSGEVTYEIRQDYVYSIYANGQPLLIAASQEAGYAELYIDANRNGIGEPGEEITYLRGSGENGGIFYREGAGYFLCNSAVYGGAKEGDCQYDTCVTLTGPAENRTVDAVYGGNASGTLTGNACVNITGGNVRIVFGGNAGGILTGGTYVKMSGGIAEFVFGGGDGGETNGNTSVEVTGGCITNRIVGGNGTGQINGSTFVSVENAQVGYVFGGNEVSGIVTGDTNLVFGDKTLATGWIYGGGAGYSNDVITEVAGSTNITINGGEFQQNIYGGGGWRGAAVGASNIVINGGSVPYDVYGGGEEQSYVAGKASITVNGGDVNRIYASGAGFNNTAAEVGEAAICLNGGKVDWFSALTLEENDKVLINGGLSFELSGDSFSDITCWFGFSGHSVSLNDVNVAFRNAAVDTCMFYASVRGSMSLSFDNAYVKSLYLAGNVLRDAEEAALSYVNCGSEEKSWREQPSLTGSHLDGNKFTTILMKDSYMNFKDDSFTTEDNTLRACTEKLIVDGGALRVIGLMISDMPPTEFRNVPLLLRSGSSEAIHFDEIPVGNARIQWMNDDGTVPADKKDRVIAEAPTEAPNRLFASGYPDYVLKTVSVARGVSEGGIMWWGKGWCAGTSEQLCNCQLVTSCLETEVFPLAEGDDGTIAVLRDVQTGSTAYSQNCEVVEHEGTAVAVAYSLISEGTTAPGAAIDGDQLTVRGTGRVHVQTTQYLNGKNIAYDSYIQFLEVPDSDSFTYTEGLAEELSLSFGGTNAETVTNYAMLWSNTEHQFVSQTDYSVTLEEETVIFHINQEYLGSLAVGEYSFNAHVPYLDGQNRRRTYIYNFTVSIVPVIEVENPVIELSEERFHYDGKAKTPSVVVKDGDTIIPTEEYEVSYRDNTDVGTAVVVITDKTGGRYTVNGSRTFEIINEYKAENGTDYSAVLNENGWVNGDFVISAGDGFLLSTGNTLADQWVASLERTEENADGSVTFYCKNTETGLISMAVTENYKLDRTAPMGYDIQFNGNSVKTELENITFAGVYGESVEVGLTAEDDLSGIGQISYLQSEGILTQEQLENAGEWINGEEFTVSAEDGKKFIIYGKAVDLAGNMVYFASEGAEFDLKGPEVGGVESGGIYNVTQVVHVTDAHPGVVILNGEPVSGDVILPGNREAVYIIRAVDLVGNETVVTVTMKSVNSLMEPIRELTENNVTSDDGEKVRQVLETAENALGGNASLEERKALQTVIAACKALDERLEAIEKEYDRMESETDSILQNPVKLTDQGALEKVEEGLGKLLEEYGSNYTEEERSRIEADLLRVKEALESIRKVQRVENIMAALPDAEGVSPDNAEAEEAAKQAKALWEALTEYEKTLVDTGRLEKLLAALKDYRILEGDGSEWTKETERDITFKANGAIEKFVGILIDGRSVESELFTVSRGSTIITLKEGLVKMLPVGTHSLTVLYSNGETSAVFEILEESSSDGEKDPDNGNETPGTGEENPGNGNETPGTGEENPGNGNETPDTGEENPDNGNETPGTGEEDPGNGNEGTNAGDKKPNISNESPDTGDIDSDDGGEGSSAADETSDGGDEEPDEGESAADRTSSAAEEEGLSISHCILWLLLVACAAGIWYGIVWRKRKKQDETD